MTITLKSFHGKYVSIDPLGRIVADRDVARSWEQVTVEPIAAPSPVPGTRLVALKSAHGKYLSAQPDGSLIADRDIVGAWEQFEVPADFPVGP